MATKQSINIATASEAWLAQVTQRHPWFVPARARLSQLRGESDPQLQLMTPWRIESSCTRTAVDAAAMVALSSDDVIDIFLTKDDLRIVAEEGEPVNEVQTEAELDDDDELVSEDLAEIYVAQGLHDKAIEIYRKLSLRNSEKSVYFAELIDRIENNN